MTSFLENLKPHNRLLTSIELSRQFNHANYDLILSEIQLQNLIFKTKRWLRFLRGLTDLGMDIKSEVFLKLFNRNKLKNATKTFLEPIFFLIYS